METERKGGRGIRRTRSNAMFKAVKGSAGAQRSLASVQYRTGVWYELQKAKGQGVGDNDVFQRHLKDLQEESEKSQSGASDLSEMV